MSQESSVRTEPIQVGALFVHRWFEAQVVEALSHAGLVVTTYADPMTFATGLRDRPVEIALIEDHDKLFQDGMNTLRFRGAVMVPVLAVGRGSVDGMRSALRCGACDYAVLGESMQTLVNRVLARSADARQAQPRAVLRAGDCWLERSSRSLQHPDGEIPLTAREFALAWLLFEQAGHVVGVTALSRQVWGRDPSIAKRTIEQHVSRLRAKLAEACRGAERQLGIQAVHNVGYRLAVGSVITPRSVIAGARGRAEKTVAGRVPDDGCLIAI